VRLFIAEKPSVAKEIAAVLDSNYKKENGYFRTKSGLVSWAYGHLFTAYEPKDYDEKFEKWSLKDLPIIPEEWKIKVNPNAKAQFKILRDLLKDCTEIVHAGDPDREGQRIIDDIITYTKTKKPVVRMILNALDEDSIKTALKSLKDNRAFFNLSKAAEARQRCDWLLGMNGTRYYSLMAQKSGYPLTINVGRVKIPTMNLVIKRETEIKDFVSENYFTIGAEFSTINKNPDTIFPSIWIKNANKKNENIGKEINEENNENKNEKKEIRYSEKDKDYIINKMQLIGKNAEGLIENIENIPKIVPPPLPHSLSSLQVAAGKKYKISPSEVLATVQTLYEKKYVSYPRSDCNFIPESQHQDAEIILQNLKLYFPKALLADTRIKNKSFDMTKVSAHHAIIPTKVSVDIDKLTLNEKNIYTLIANSYIVQFMQAWKYTHTVYTILFNNETFEATGNVTNQLGWKQILDNTETKKRTNSAAEIVLPEMKKSEKVRYLKTTINAKKTKPPERYTQSTLLDAMRKIAKYIEDEKLAKLMKDIKGIGTEATRAEIIKSLLSQGFFAETDKVLTPTEKAYTTAEYVSKELLMPDQTALWEFKLNSIMDGTLKSDVVVREYSQYIENICKGNQ
jgi:DNA topoisomerase-3